MADLEDTEGTISRTTTTLCVEIFNFWHMLDEIYNFDNTQFSPQKNSTFFAGPERVSDPCWYADSGATNHVTAEMENLQFNTEYKGKEKLMMGNDRCLTITHTRTSLPPLDKDTNMKLNNILRLPNIKKSMISIS